MKKVINIFKNRYDTIDKNLLLNKPWLWETKFHLALSLSAGLSIFSIVISTLFMDQIIGSDLYGMTVEPAIPTSMALLSLVGLGYWISKHIFLIGDHSNVHISKKTFRLQFVAYFASCLAFALPVGITFLFGYLDFQLDSYEVNSQMYRDWGLHRGFEVETPLAVVVGLFTIASLIQVVKSIDAFQLLKSLSLYAILIVTEALIWNLSVWLGLITGVATIVIIAWVINQKDKAAESPKINAAQFIIALFMQILLPVSCCMISYIPAAILAEGIFTFLNINWVAVIIGLSIFTYTIMPQFHMYYLRYRQLPTI